MEKLKIVGISDLHGNLHDYQDDDFSGDILCICGDIVPLSIQTDTNKTESWFMNEFLSWCSKLKFKKIFFIAGNHDIALQNDSNFFKRNFPLTYFVSYLEDELAIYNKDGVDYKIYGTPWCKRFGRWAFMASNKELRDKFSKIPYDLDILITHDEPYGTNDISLQDTGYPKQHFGSMPLFEAIETKQPRIHLAGHIHSGNHIPTRTFDTLSYNCSLLDEEYTLTYLPQIIYLPNEGE